jgi:hypothetical protein
MVLKMNVSNYFEETLKFIESEEMREYLRTRRDWFDGQAHGGEELCAKIVSRAPAPIERKIPALELIATQIEHTTSDCKYAATLAREAAFALEERYTNCSGAIFVVLEQQHYPTYCTSFTLYTGFDAALRYIKERKAEIAAKAPEELDSTSYTITKYLPAEDGVMEGYFNWILNCRGEIWYFDYERWKFRPKHWQDFFNYLGQGIALPLPFAPGDIILADCRPFAE